MKQTITEETVAALVKPVIEDLGYRMVRVQLGGDGKRRTLQIMAEDPDTRGLNVDECARISREVSAILDVEDPIEGFYNLEVSSPGIDRPLVTIDDFSAFKGFEAKIEIEPAIEGQKRFRGRLDGAEQDKGIVTILTDTGPRTIDYDAIQKAKLVLTDELIEKTQAIV